EDEGATPRRPRYVPLPPWKPFPVHCLPGPWRQFAEQGARSLSPDCEPAFLALPIISVLAGAVGNSRVLMVREGWFEVAVWWSCVVGESGTIKSPALEMVVGLIIARQKKLLAQYREKLKTYREQLAAWKAEGREAGEEEPVRPKPERLLVSDITVEK